MQRLLVQMLSLTLGFLTFAGAWQPLAAQNEVMPKPIPLKPDVALKVTVNLRVIHVYSGEQLSLMLQVTNVSATEQTFQAMSCSWPDDWQVSGARLYSPGFPCAANWFRTVTLMPRASYTQTLRMTVGAMPKGKVGFEMGSTPCGAAGNITTYWSEKVLLQVN